MTSALLSTTAEMAADGFGSVFGSQRGRSAAQRLTAPTCPRTGCAEMAVLRRGLGDEDPYWEVGWYGSHWTFTLMPRRGEDRQALWQEHRRFRHIGIDATEVELLRLRHEDAYPHLRLSFEQVPEEVQERILREVARGVHPLSGSTNDRPLRPF